MKSLLDPDSVLNSQTGGIHKETLYKHKKN
jgi:hypothetical protein